MPRGVYVRSEEYKRKVSEFRKGKPSPTKGLKWSLEAKLRWREILPRGENSPSWRGEEVGYSGLHKWVRQQLGSANKCISADDTCKGLFEWSNISHEYHRDLDDWQQLCQSHHLRYDGRVRDRQGKFAKQGDNV